MPTWDLSLPVDVVEGSARAWFTAVGDLMGPALQVIHPSTHSSNRSLIISHLFDWSVIKVKQITKWGIGI